MTALAASICTHLLADGGPGWLNLLVLLFIWNALKFLLIGPVSLALLITAHTREHRAARSYRKAMSEGHDMIRHAAR